MTACRTPIPDGTLVDYWTGDLADGDEADLLEDHLFECGDCANRLEQLAALGAGVSALARAGRINGVVSRALLNRLQRDGVRIRTYALAPGETVACAVFPGDELVVTDLRADVTGVDAVSVSFTGPGASPFSRYDDVSVSGPTTGILLAVPAAMLRDLPSMRLEITVTSQAEAPVTLGRYALEHTAQGDGDAATQG